MLSVDNVVVNYGQSEALHGVSFSGQHKARLRQSWAATAWVRPRCSRR